ncbi:MAG: carbon starvation protein A [Phycisphaerales bacterium]|jgi:carbon starvation protein|nr:carbon starvation protein A [Phycisphaerales bacterium]
MATVLIALGSFALYIVAYHTYGRFLARRIFRIDPGRRCPSEEFADGRDFVPSHRDVVFGHHFTSIAGTGPIVGPAVAVVWGWVPALIWVLVGSIVMGAVHDFGSLIVSMRNKGRTIADLAGPIVSPRVRLLFLLVVLMGLWIVLAVFGLVIAGVFALYPSAVVPVWAQLPIAIALGLWTRRGGSLLFGSIVAVGLMYATIAWSASVDWSGVSFIPKFLDGAISPTAFWTLILLAYVAVASVMPVQWLLQPRDYINSHQLLVAMGLLVVGVLAARPAIVADAVNLTPLPPSPGAAVPSFMPFLFVTIACGAISGFHCLVASGTTSRQLRCEKDAQYVAYGGMLTEGFLATLVIIACVAGIGLGTQADGATLTGAAAWRHHYATWGGDSGLKSIIAPFVTGAANMIETLGLSHALALTAMGVFIASFASTTLDSATRLQRYVIEELAGRGRAPGEGFRVPILTNRYVATGVAVVSAGALALSDALARDPTTNKLKGLENAGRGGLTLWPIFGATNQLLGGLALLVVTVWLVRQRRPAWVTAIPMLFMLVMTAWAIGAMVMQFAGQAGKQHLLIVSGLVLLLELWIVAEAAALVFSGRARAPQPAS